MMCAVFAVGYMYIAAKITRCTVKEYTNKILQHKFALVGAGCAVSSTTTWFLMMLYSLM